MLLSAPAKSRISVALFLFCLSSFASKILADSLIQAECWLDNDTNFNFNEHDGGLVFGSSSRVLRQACGDLAKERFGTNSSFGLKNTTPTTAISVQGECWLDNDPKFSPNQVYGGKVIGDSTQAIVEDCSQAAAAAFSNGSFSVRDAALPPGANPLVRAECWLDNKGDFTSGKFDAGEMFGQTTADIRQACRETAETRFGEKGTSALKNVATVGSSFVQAECWVDDDPKFTFDQISGGTLIGFSSQDLRSECAFIASSRYGADGSSGIREYTPYTSGPSATPTQPATFFSAECWLDDDTNFDFDKTTGGTVTGSTTYDLQRLCQSLASNRFGSNSSSGIRQVTSETRAGDIFSADCWIDNDSNFNFDKIKGGTVYAKLATDLQAECEQVAQARFGENSTFGIKNIAQSTTATRGVQGQCWMDDDLDFNFNKFDGGTVYGQSSLELRTICQTKAETEHGENSTSGVKSVQTYNAVSDFFRATAGSTTILFSTSATSKLDFCSLKTPLN